MSTDHVIRVRGLSNSFGSQMVHENLDLDVRRGEVIGVVGSSGSGKSVLLRSLLGLLRPQRGDIRVLGVDVRSASPAQRRSIERQTGVLFQGGALFSSLTVLENIAVPIAEKHDLPADLINDLCWMKLRLTGLSDDAAHKFPMQLSGGMKKRAALARALALCPTLLFLDEPTAGLDPISAAAFDKLILDLRQALGFTVFLITHDLDTLYGVCDRVAMLAERRVLVCASLAEVERYDHPWVQAFFHGRRGRAARREV